jgi:hypothetical protein
MAQYEDKFIVINRKHLPKVKEQNPNAYENFINGLHGIQDYLPTHGYISCNMDEPYAQQVLQTILDGEDKKTNVKSEFTKYKRTNIAEMRYYIKGEDLSNISVSDQDDPDSDMGMIARNPDNHKDQWYIARKYFEENFEAI